MKNKQNRIQIKIEDATNIFGYHYCVNNGKHEEDLDLVIEQCLGHSSGFGLTAETLEDAIKLHDEILKEHCQNVINRYEKFAKSIKGRVFYKLYRIGLLKKSRKQVVDEYLNIVESARAILISGKEPVVKNLSQNPKNNFYISKDFPKIGQIIYFVENNLNKDFFKIEQYVVKDYSVYIQDKNLNNQYINIETYCVKIDDTIKKHIHNSSIEAFNGQYYELAYDSKGFVNLSDAQKYADERLLEVIEQAKQSMESNKTI